jgi:hypothetical protein
MKSKIFLLLAVSFLSAVSVLGQNGTKKINPVGSWKFEAPYAPEGYTSGTISVGLEQKIYSASMSFTGSDYKLAGEKMKVVNDSILFSVYLEGQDIRVMLKIEDKAKMTGKAVYSEGEVPLTLTKDN